jgi:hypothetical protein
MLAAGCSDKSSSQQPGDAGVGGASNDDARAEAGPQEEAGEPDDDADMPAECMGPSDPRLVIASQRVVHLSKLQLVNTISALIGEGAATAILAADSFNSIGNETNLRIPLLASVGESETINSDPDSFPLITDLAQAAADYVFAHFQEVTGCAAGDDACAAAYVSKLAKAAFRRPLAGDEAQRIAAVYVNSKSQLVNGWSVTATVEEAARNAVFAIFAAPQTLWRTEIGDPSAATGATLGVPLTEYELASTLAYFLTGGPPDDALIAEAAGGTLHANLDAQTARIMATPAARSWLTSMMFVSMGVNRLFEARVDPSVFPAIGGTTLQDMYTEAKMFLDDALWSGTLKDLLLSRTSFINTNLATNIYGIAPPAGADDTTFARATLPADRRSGLLTNAGFITLRARDTRESLIFRAQLVEQTFLCSSPDGPPEDLREAVAAAGALFQTQTGQEQVNYRRTIPACARCHVTFDAYGLALDGYDNIGRDRSTVSFDDGRVVAVDAHTTLPQALGGGAINGAVDLASALAASDLFSQCMAKRVLEMPMAELSAFVDFPTPTELLAGNDPSAGCAVRDVAARFAGAGGRTLGDLVRAVVASPTFLLRAADSPGAGPADAADTDAPSSTPDAGQPGDAGAPSAPDVLKTLVLKRTVLDFVLNEIGRMQRVVPPLARSKLDYHAQAVSFVTSAIASSIRNVGSAPH